MARFWSRFKGLRTGNNSVEAQFENGSFVTDDQDVIKMLRSKIKAGGLDIIELSEPAAPAPSMPEKRDDPAPPKKPDKSKAIKPDDKATEADSNK